MRYVGGKAKIASALVSVIRTYSPHATIAVEPFMGGGSVTAKLAESFDRVIANDAHPDAAALWKAVVSGWTPPEEISEQQYAALRSQDAPSAMRGLAGFGGSFGGKFFGGYARGGHNASGAPRNHQGESARAVKRIQKSLRANGNVTVSCLDYRDVEVPFGSVVYCDPPYSGTLSYATGEFDSEAFWGWAREQSAHADVYVSEYSAPSGWVAVWCGTKRQSVTMPAQGRELRQENLFRIE